jgi:aryl-alcohol dehydrogenase-like predicted oxidoreductase
MKTHRLGPLGPDLTVVGYGGWELGGRVDRTERPEDELVEAVLAAFRSGINWVDTAETYGAGRSERIVGRACAEWDGEVFVASKLAPIPSSSGSGFEPWQVRWGAERTLSRLGRDSIDLYMLHWPDEQVDLRSTWSAMASLVEDGLASAIGLSNFPLELVEVCGAIRRVDFLQVEFSLLNHAAAPLLAWCGQRGIAGLTYGSLGYGILAGTRRASPGDDGSDFYLDLFADGRLAGNLRSAGELVTLAGELGCSAAQLALAWTLHQPGVACALAGSRNAAHIQENASAGDISLSDEQLQLIDAALGGRRPTSSAQS